MRTFVEILALLLAFQSGVYLNEKPELRFPAQYAAVCAVGLIVLATAIWGL